jgi:hypothetical protein
MCVCVCLLVLEVRCEYCRIYYVVGVKLLRSSVLNTGRKRFILGSAVEFSCSLSRLLLSAVRCGFCRFDC